MAVDATNKPNFLTQTPTVLNVEDSNVLAITLPILNSGDASADNLKVTEISLQSASPVNGFGVPVHIGKFAAGNVFKVSAQFSSNTLSVGSIYLLTVSGVYTVFDAVHGFTVNRQLTVPPSQPSPVSYLSARVDVVKDGGLWNYTIHNDESVSSNQFIAAFSLDAAVPFTVTGTPHGWEVETNNRSYILWSAIGGAPSYEGQVAPNGILSGFQISSASLNSESTSFVLTSWNHMSDDFGLAYPGLIHSPARPA